MQQSYSFAERLSHCRYVISANRVLIKINDGAYAVQIKDFLVDQERCEVVTIDGNDYPGKG